jgi:hypothetical protein
MGRILGAITMLMMSQVPGMAEPQQFDLDVPPTQWQRTYRLSLDPLEAPSYFTRDLPMTAQSGSPVRQAGGWCQLHRGWFALNWLRGQSHSESKSLGALTVSMGRKSSLRRDSRAVAGAAP